MLLVLEKLCGWVVVGHIIGLIVTPFLGPYYRVEWVHFSVSRDPLFILPSTLVQVTGAMLDTSVDPQGTTCQHVMV